MVRPTYERMPRGILRRLSDYKRRRKLDKAIVEGYRRHPPTRQEEAWVDAASRDFIREEPW